MSSRLEADGPQRIAADARRFLQTSVGLGLALLLVASSAGAPGPAYAQSAPSDAAKWGKPLPPTAPQATEPSTVPYDVEPSVRWTRIVVLADLAFGWSLDGDGWQGLATMLRGGAGVQSRFDDWSILTLVTAEVCSESSAPPAAGAVFVLDHEDGLQGHAGALLDLDARLGAFVDFGYDFVSVEVQRRALTGARHGKAPWLFYAKLTVPIFVGGLL